MQTAKLSILTALVLCGAAEAAPIAAPTESTTLYVGGLALRNHSQAGDLKGAGVPAGLNLNVGHADTLAFALEQRSGPQWGVELALGDPPRVSASAAGASWSGLGVTPGAQIVRASALSPTVYLNYHFSDGDGRSGWDPFVGFGLNYTHFLQIQTSSALNNSRLGPTSVKLGDSWGPAAQVGVVYHIDRNWSVLASAAVARVRSDLTASSPQAPAGGVTATTRVNFRPQIYKLAIGYSF